MPALLGVLRNERCLGKKVIVERGDEVADEDRERMFKLRMDKLAVLQELRQKTKGPKGGRVSPWERRN